MNKKIDKLLDMFYKHKILIDVRGASREELIKLHDIINVRYVDGSCIYEYIHPHVNFLHCRDDGVTFSKEAFNYGNGRAEMLSVSYLDFIENSFEISEEEYENVYK